MQIKFALLFITCLIGYTICYSQNDSTTKGLPDVTALQSKYVDKVDKKITALESSIEKSTLKTLQHLQKQEQKLQKKLALKDSVAAKALFAQNKYQQFADKIKNPPVAAKLKEYMPQFDSLKTSLAFLTPPYPPKGGDGVATLLPANDMTKKLKEAMTHVSGLEGKLQQANELKAYIKERKQLLKAELEKFGMLKQLKSLNKEAYYYTAQINEYKAILKDPKKIEQKALALLNKMPAFTDFMKKNSMLAQLFKMPDNYGSAESLAGLQTRASVQNIIQAKFGLTPDPSPHSGEGGNAQQYLNQQMQAAQGELNKLKSLTPTLSEGEGGKQSEGGFKPNSQKVKTFLKRIEYGANVQSQRPNSLLPVATDFAATAGYKLNDKSIIGIGASYKLGWGNGFKDIHFSTQGFGLRSYVDVKLKGGIWISGGYEKNYQNELTPASQEIGTGSFQGRGVRITPWQTSGLIGITKKYKIGKKTNSLQLLWDFLSYQQVPKTQPIVFRVGYCFN